MRQNNNGNWCNWKRARKLKWQKWTCRASPRPSGPAVHHKLFLFPELPPSYRIKLNGLRFAFLWTSIVWIGARPVMECKIRMWARLIKNSAWPCIRVTIEWFSSYRQNWHQFFFVISSGDGISFFCISIDLICSRLKSSRSLLFSLRKYSTSVSRCDTSLLSSDTFDVSKYCLNAASMIPTIEPSPLFNLSYKSAGNRILSCLFSTKRNHLSIRNVSICYICA